VTADDLLVSPATAAVIGAAGVAAMLTYLFPFLFPRSAIAIWPWSLTEVTARVTSTIFALGAVGFGAFVERRWTSPRVLLQVEGVMLVLIAIAVIRSRGDFDTGNP